MKILASEHSKVYRKFAKHLRKERVAIDKENKTNTKYLVAEYEGNPVGVVGWCYIADNHVRFKTAYINPSFRGKKIYTDLWNARINAILSNEQVRYITAYCTEMSLPKFLKEGFVPQSVRNNITYVKNKIK
jgi:hypothetical protein